ncbi:maleylpyruvate isomerase family mycothiol-dependent enzyme [Lentzea tibetensis]|uniref:Maleylpyruvate isomerase family mycothiol-dependent enzyme n=1 Tax=Lentzea tibetensis TaxID=2591470 RepID=A0A563ELA3_9PSEU|nr:maleylpyruvate isomerase family mycothiol-dependent enzyme [Lentzea tibetensis]TWP47854.1 maleylpyruvate isomerase family mycothiol-dependent enzyme [Lentzea tibetensis]
MDLDRIWPAINAQRARTAELLEQLSDDEWARPSLCSGWTVRDVAGHLAWQCTPDVGRSLVVLLKARGDVNRLIHLTAVEHATRPTTQLVAEIRALIGTHKHPPGVGAAEVLIDNLVHSQDIAVPLDRPLPLAQDAAAAAADRVWSRGWPFHARKKFAGYRLSATDCDWSAGTGAEVRGPMEALLMVLTGRLTALSRLHGEGAAGLTTQLA